MYDSQYEPVTGSTHPWLTQLRPTSASSYDHPAAFYDLSDLSFLLWSSSCILRLVQPQLPATILHLLQRPDQPTPATRNQHQAALTYVSTIPATNVTILAEDHIRPSRTLHTFVDLTINCHLLYLLPRLCSFIVFGCHLLTRIKLNSFVGSTCLSAPQCVHI